MSSWVKVVALYLAGAVTLPLIMVIAYFMVLDSYRESEWRLRDVSYSPDGRYKVRVETHSNVARIRIQYRNAFPWARIESVKYLGSHYEEKDCYPMISLFWRSPLELAVYGGTTFQNDVESIGFEVGRQTLSMVRYPVSAQGGACIPIDAVSPLEKWLARQ
jgi:hypothetical protein